MASRNFKNPNYIEEHNIEVIENANFEVENSAVVPFKYYRMGNIVVVQASVKCLAVATGSQAIGKVPIPKGVTIQTIFQNYNLGNYATGLIQNDTLYIRNATQVNTYYGCTVSYFA